MNRETEIEWERGKEIERHNEKGERERERVNLKDNPISFKPLALPHAFLLEIHIEYLHSLNVCPVSIKKTSTAPAVRRGEPSPENQINPKKELSEYLRGRATIPQSNKSGEESDRSVCYGLLNIYRGAFKDELIFILCIYRSTHRETAQWMQWKVHKINCQWRTWNEHVTIKWNMLLPWLPATAWLCVRTFNSQISIYKKGVITSFGRVILCISMDLKVK